jgi:hypothetical protein
MENALLHLLSQALVLLKFLLAKAAFLDLGSKLLELANSGMKGL